MSRDAIAAFLCDQLGMHVIEETDNFTLVGVDAKLGKVTLFDAEGPREPGPLQRIALRVGDPPPWRRRDSRRRARRRRGPRARRRRVRIGLVEADGREFDLDHVVLSLADPEAAAAELVQLGFERRNGVLAVADRTIRLERGSATTAAGRSSTILRCSSTTLTGSRTRRSATGSRSTT